MSEQIIKLTRENSKNIDVKKLVFVEIFTLDEMFDFPKTIHSPYMRGYIRALFAVKVPIYYTQSNDNLFAFWFLSN